MNYPNADDYNDSNASAVDYNITILTTNRVLTSQEQAAIQRIVQDAINIMATKLTFAVRDPRLAKLMAFRISSVNGQTDMFPETENSHDGASTENYFR